MRNDFRSYNVIDIVYDRKNENHWPLLITRYSLILGIQTPFFKRPRRNECILRASPPGLFTLFF